MIKFQILSASAFYTMSAITLPNKCFDIIRNWFSLIPNCKFLLAYASYRFSNPFFFLLELIRYKK